MRSRVARDQRPAQKISARLELPCLSSSGYQSAIARRLRRAASFLVGSSEAAFPAAKARAHACSGSGAVALVSQPRATSEGVYSPSRSRFYGSRRGISGPEPDRDWASGGAKRCRALLGLVLRGRAPRARPASSNQAPTRRIAQSRRVRDNSRRGRSPRGSRARGNCQRGAQDTRKKPRPARSRATRAALSIGREHRRYRATTP